MSYLKEILAICSTALGVAVLIYEKDGAVLTAVVGFWGVLLGSEVQKKAEK